MPWPKGPLSLPDQKRECGIFGLGMVKEYIVYLGCKVVLFRPSVEFSVLVVGELARAKGKRVFRTEDEYCKHTRLKGPLSPRCTPYFL